MCSKLRSKLYGQYVHYYNVYVTTCYIVLFTLPYTCTQYKFLAGCFPHIATTITILQGTLQ